MIIEIRHIGIVVNDYQKSLDFYQLLGFVKSSHRVESTPFIDMISVGHDIDLKTTRLTAPNGGMIELLEYGNHTEMKINTLFGNGIAHFAVTVEAIDTLYHRLIENGIEFLSPPIPSPNGYAKVAFCKATEGKFIELVEVLQARIIK